MIDHKVKIISVNTVTHDVRQFVVEKPTGYTFVPGQATEISINKEGWKDQKRPFTFTSLNDSENLEFIIKIYPSHDGVTNELSKLKSGDELIIRDVWGAIAYKGKGVFIAAGAGITPFIAILRDLEKKNALNGNKLIFSNKTSKDIILKDEFERMLGPDFIRVLTKEKYLDAHFGRIDRKYLEGTIRDFDQHFYICGPEKFVESMQFILKELGAKTESVVIEK
jgi:ferredoxin-NADP reductase